MNHLYRYTLLPLLLLLLSGSFALGQTPDTSAGSIAVESLLNPDGTINLNHHLSGSINLNGWKLVAGPNGEPRFVRDGAKPEDNASLMVEDTANQAWDNIFGPPGLDGPAYCAVVVDSSLYIGGSFTIAGSALAHNIVRWDGTKWHSLGIGVGGPIYAMCVYSGYLYAGGQFLSAGDVTAQCLARLNLTTGLWSNIGGGVYSVNFVYGAILPAAMINAIAVRDSFVYIGGSFEQVAHNTSLNKALRNFARWNLSSQQWDQPAIASAPIHAMTFVGDTLYIGSEMRGGVQKLVGSRFDTLATGLDSTVYALAEHDGSLYAGGSFNKAGSLTTHSIARWDLTQHTWASVGSGFNGVVYSLGFDQDNLYAGGTFTATGSNSVNYVARYSGSAWNALGSGLADTATPQVHLVIPYGGKIYAGGRFLIAGTSTARNIGVWDGSNWTAVGAGGVDVNRNGLNGAVYAAVVRGNDLYVGGDFTRAGGIDANRVAHWNGEEWFALGKGVDSPIGLVRSLALDSSGNLYVGGAFTTAGGVPANGLARWDGSTWGAVGGSMGGVNPYVFALTVAGNNLYVGGGFSSAGGTTANKIAVWNMTTSTWSALGAGMKGDSAEYVYVTSIAVDGATVYAGGSFTHADNISARNLAKWDGSVWAPMATPPLNGANGEVDALLVRNGTLYAAGTFTQIGPDLARHVAELTGDGWSNLGGGVDATVSSLAMDSQGRLIAGGDFTVADSSGASHIAFWNGTKWAPFGTGTNGSVRTLATSGESVFAGGEFSIAGGQKANHIGRWDLPVWSSLGSDPTAGLTGQVLAIAVADTDIFVGGVFRSAGGMRAGGVTRWDGHGWVPMGKGVNGTVRSMLVKGKDVYVGGEFSLAGDVPCTGLARYDRSAKNWTAVPGAIAGSSPYVFAMLSHGNDLYVGGSFQEVGGVPGTKRIARFNTATQQWSNLQGGISGSGYYTYVSALAADSSGNLYVGGIFPQAGTTDVSNIARWDGANWTSLGKGVNNAVYDIAVDGSKIYVGGQFRFVGDTTTWYMANFDGSRWHNMAGFRFDGAVYALAINNGFVYAGGEFIVADKVVASGVARWDGTRWLGMGDGVTYTDKGGAVYALGIQNGLLCVGGSFSLAGFKPSYYFARWNPSGAIVGDVKQTDRATANAATLGLALYPNPASLSTTVEFSLEHAANTTVELFALDGRRVAALVDEFLPAGHYKRRWATEEVPAGSYLCRIQSGSVSQTGRVEVVK